MDLVQGIISAHTARHAIFIKAERERRLSDGLTSMYEEHAVPL